MWVQRWSSTAGALALICATAACGSEADSDTKSGKQSGAGGAAGSGGEAGAAGSAGGGGALPYCVPDESAPVPARPSYGKWERVELPGTVCGNGSQYKFFVNYSETSNNVLVMFEAGGACWDYDSCTGSNGIRGAANPDGIGNGHMTQWGLAYPFYHRGDEENPLRDWNYVFIPYCTGDVHTGNNVITYTSEDGSDSVEFHHAGHPNMLKVVEWLNDEFENVPRMMAGGCSAGGAGSLLNYYFLRSRIQGVQCGYLLDDAGPIFPSSGNSAQLHQKIRDSWDADATIDTIEAEVGKAKADALRNDFGTINTLLADEFPMDRLAITFFRLDLNYSIYSYERFFGFPPYETILDLWWEDTQLLMEQYDTRENLAYYIPYYRADNCSHCASLVPVNHVLGVLLGTTDLYLGTEIQEEGIDLRGYTQHLLDDEAPLESYLESVQENEGFTPEEGAACL